MQPASPGPPRLGRSPTSQCITARLRGRRKASSLTVMAPATATSRRPRRRVRAKIIKWELSGCTVAVTPVKGPKHGAITCSYDNQDDLKLLCGRASRRDWAFCPVAFASGLSETSHGWSARLEGFAGGLTALVSKKI